MISPFPDLGGPCPMYAQMLTFPHRCSTKATRHLILLLALGRLRGHWSTQASEKKVSSITIFSSQFTRKSSLEGSSVRSSEPAHFLACSGFTGGRPVMSSSMTTPNNVPNVTVNYFSTVCFRANSLSIYIYICFCTRASIQ